jgi:tRNA(adenine34) deaminase
LAGTAAFAGTSFYDFRSRKLRARAGVGRAGAGWREAFTLAWKAYGAGTIPVGAVVTRDGQVIARGRNRLFERVAPPGEISGSRIAHTEMNAIAHLPIDDRYHNCVLWSTLEPCAMCIGAAWIGTIGTVRFAGRDAYAGAARLIEAQLERLDRARGDPLTVNGPLQGPFGTLGELLHIDWFVAKRPDNRVTLAFRERCPELVALAERVRLHEHVEEPIEEALPRFLDAL